MDMTQPTPEEDLRAAREQVDEATSALSRVLDELAGQLRGQLLGHQSSHSSVLVPSCDRPRNDGSLPCAARAAAIPGTTMVTKSASR